MFGLSGRQVLILLILAALVFAGTQYVPPYFAAFQFNDYVRQEVKYAATARKTVEVLRANVLSKAKELGIPVTKNDIRIIRRGPSFTLDVDYRWPIDLKVYRHELQFHTSQSGEIFENASN
jgi:nitrogen fixation protein FixH